MKAGDTAVTKTLWEAYAGKRLVEGLAPDGEWEGRAGWREDPTFGGLVLMAKVWCNRCRNMMFGNEVSVADGFITDHPTSEPLLAHLKESFKGQWRIGRHSCKYEAWRREKRPWMDRVCNMSPARLPGHPHHEQYVEDMKRYKELDD
jgi:hypothetical protein